jgi:hypothetical protein
MKGDDVLAIDLDSEQPRIIVGEAKFRGTPSIAGINQILESLHSSFINNTPASIQFVINILSEQGNHTDADRISNIVVSIANGQIQPEYVGMLMSSIKAAQYVERTPQTEIHRLVMISLAFQIRSP